MGGADPCGAQWGGCWAGEDGEAWGKSGGLEGGHPLGRPGLLKHEPLGEMGNADQRDTEGEGKVATEAGRLEGGEGEAIGGW